MFEPLDDPNPPIPEPGSCARVIGRARRRRRRRHRRVAATATGAVAVGVLAVAGFFVTEARRLDQVARVDVATQPSAVAGVQTILVVGTDQGLSPARTSVAADSIAAVRIDSHAHTASVLGVPRDLLVADTTSGVPTKVDDVFRTHGPSGLVASIHQSLGLDIDHYIQVDPAGFEALVDASGGVKLRASGALRDNRSGLHLDRGACTALDGATALALARSRYLEIDMGGGWVPLSPVQNDLDRMVRDRILGGAVLDAIHAVDGADPRAIDHLVDTVVDHVTVDDGLRRNDLIGLVRVVRHVPSASLRISWLPVKRASVGGASALTLGTGWQAAVADFTAGDAPSSTIPTQVDQDAPGRSTFEPILEPC